MTISQFSRGSEWRKWDLHVHSPMSILNNKFPKCSGGTPDWEAYIAKLEESDISVLGITDYFTVDGYKEILKFREQGRLANICTILPNIEFRLKDTVDNKGINFHVLFCESISAEIIEEHFLHELYISVEGRPQFPDEKDKLKKSVLQELGRGLKNENKTNFIGLSDAAVGAMFARVDHDQISQLLDSKRFRGKYALVLASDNLSDWDGPSNATRRILTQKTDFAFTPNEKNIRWFLGRKGYSRQRDFIAEFKSLKPSLHGCDAHCLTEINRPCTKRHFGDHDCKKNPTDCCLRFCWIKADPTFEGLKQVLYEPEERVRIRASKPVSSRHIYTFQNVSISESEISSALSVCETDLPLNSGLVAVTGGKGAGKTALVDMMANCFLDRKNSKDKNSFVRRIALDSKPDMQTSLEFIGVDSFSKNLTEDKLIDNIELSYISQGELDTYIEDGSTLYERVKEILFEAASPEQKHDFKEISDSIRIAEHGVREATTTILQFESETSKDVLLDLDVRTRRMQTELDDLNRQIEEQDISDEDLAKADAVDTVVSELRGKERLLKSLIDLIESAIPIIEKEMARYNEDVRAINELLESQELKKLSLPKLKQMHVTVDGAQKLLDESKNELRTTLQAIYTKEHERNSFDAQVSKRAELLEKKREMQDRQDSLRAESENIEKLRAKMTDARKRRRADYLQMLNHLRQLQSKYSDIINSFASQLSDDSNTMSSGESDVLKEIHFLAETRFHRDSFTKRANDLFDLRRVTVEGENSDFKSLLDLSADFTRQADADNCALYNAVETLFRDPELRKMKLKATSLDSFADVLFANNFSVRPIITYKGTSVDRLSLGQKATVLINIYLRHGTNPIIIDSHDDHLDNQFIMDELIPALRQAKKHRQIVLVSNNANVVVNSDAEQIIIAEHDEGRISYVSGSLENPSIRSKAIKVLEGGKQAFEQRQKKYRMA